MDNWEPPIEWELTRCGRLVLQMLVGQQYITRQQYRDRRGGHIAAENALPVQLTAVARLLRSKFGIEVRARHGVGWYLTKADKQRLRELCEAEK